MTALSGIKVLDLSRVLAGPWSTQLLGDLGAEIIKVERPGIGDDTRGWGPPFIENSETGSRNAAYFHCANRNKKSVEIDFQTPAGQAVIKNLVKECDILVENFKVGKLQTYGLDYDSLKVINPALVYCSITGFGQTGPLAEKPGYDFLIQAMGGLMSITGKKDGEAGGGPQKVGVAVTDLFTGMYATVGILAALRHAEKTGEGQHIDIALLDCQLAMLANQGMNYLVSGEAPVRLGNTHPNIVPYQDFETADGHVILAVGNDGQFAKFCKAVGTNWDSDAKFSDNEKRVANRDQLISKISLIMKKKTTNDWTSLLNEAGVPGGPLNTIKFE